MRDKMYGGRSNDLLRGRGGNDSLHGGPQADTMKGGLGADTLKASPDPDGLYGGAGDDNLTDYFDDNVLDGGPGDDNLYGTNRLYGGSGNDHVVGSTSNPSGTRIISGGTGEDKIGTQDAIDTSIVDHIFAVDNFRDTISCGGGEDTVYFDKGLDYVNPNNCEKRRAR